MAPKSKPLLTIIINGKSACVKFASLLVTYSHNHTDIFCSLLPTCVSFIVCSLFSVW